MEDKNVTYVWQILCETIFYWKGAVELCRTYFCPFVFQTQIFGEKQKIVFKHVEMFVGTKKNDTNVKMIIEISWEFVIVYKRNHWKGKKINKSPTLHMMMVIMIVFIDLPNKSDKKEVSPKK